MLRRISLSCLFLLTVIRLLSSVKGFAAPQSQANVISDCSANGVTTAVAQGGAITFDCGANPVTISLNEITIAADQIVTIEGGNLVTLSGGDTNRIFQIGPGGSLALNNITLSNGNSGSEAGGAILNEGTLTLDHTTVRDSKGSGGAAIHTQDGTVVVRNSQLLNNQATASGGAISNQNGTVSIFNSLLEGNHAVNFAGVDSVGQLVMRTSTVRGNLAEGGYGGGIGIQDGNALIEDSLIEENQAGSGGGGIYISPNYQATVTIRRSRILHNQADITLDGTQGGGIYSGSVLTLDQVTVDDNRSYHSAGIYQYGSNGNLTIHNTTLSNNQAVHVAGGLWLNGAQGHTLSNVTISGNSAGDWGGGIYALDVPTALNFATIYGNSAPLGANLYTVRTTLTLTGVLFAVPAGGGTNCGSEGSAQPIQSAGYNLDSDGSCGLSGLGDQSNVDPKLGPLADNGGPTLTHLPQTGSPAIERVPVEQCLVEDQRGYVRPALSPCDSGAVDTEGQPQSSILPDPNAITQKQATSLEEIVASSTLSTFITFNDGIISSAIFELSTPTELAGDPLAQSQWFLDTYHDLFAIEDTNTEWELLDHTADNEHFYFQQIHSGIPVYPGQVAIHLADNVIYSMNGSYAPTVVPPPDPILSATQATKMAVKLQNFGHSVVVEPQLRYFDPQQLGLDGDLQLAWEVAVGDGRVTKAIEFIGASNGTHLFTIPLETNDFDLDLEDGNNNTQSDLCSIFEDDDIGANDDPPDSQNAVNFFTRTYDFWRNVFGRDSYDADGEQIEVNIHVDFEKLSPNASYGPCDLFFFSPNMVTQNIVGHEFSHAVDAASHNLVYANQSGALDESFADVFGYFVDPDDWLHGEGSATAGPPQTGIPNCSAIWADRDLSNPPCHYQPDHKNGLRPAVSNPDPEINDNGHVHTNSGIPNKAAYLLIQGGVFNEYSISGIGRVKAQHLFYNTLTHRVVSNTDFIGMRDAAIAEAIALARRGEYGFRSGDVCAVRQAYAAVGIGWDDRNCNGINDVTEPDPDGDGVQQKDDNCPNIFNPAPQSDIDHDAKGDACDDDIDGDGKLNNQDNCRYNFNPGQDDTNRNDIGNACDDRDGDHVIDQVDKCPDIYDYYQEDLDNDGVGDACDPDKDGDGWWNNLDNCPVNNNPDQKDESEIAIGLPSDGIGDACDLCQAVSSKDNVDLDRDEKANPCDDDDDGDTKLDVDDNCPLVPNQDQFDWDENQIGFACDPNEQRAFAGYTRSKLQGKVILNDGYRIPIPICVDCPQEMLPNNFEEVIKLILPADFKAQIVDNRGVVIDKGIQTEFGIQFRFKPVPNSKTIFENALPVSRMKQEESLPFNADPTSIQTRYFINFLAGPNANIETPQEIAITMTEQISEETPNEVFLPVIVR